MGNSPSPAACRHNLVRSKSRCNLLLSQQLHEHEPFAQWGAGSGMQCATFGMRREYHLVSDGSDIGRTCSSESAGPASPVDESSRLVGTPVGGRSRSAEAAPAGMVRRVLGIAVADCLIASGVPLRWGVTPLGRRRDPPTSLGGGPHGQTQLQPNLSTLRSTPY